MIAKSSIETNGKNATTDVDAQAYARQTCENTQSEDAEDPTLSLPSLHERNTLSNIVTGTSCIEEVAPIPSEAIVSQESITGAPEVVEKIEGCARKNNACGKIPINFEVAMASLLKSESTVMASQQINYTRQSGGWNRPGAYFVRIPLMWQRPLRRQEVEEGSSTAPSLSELPRSNGTVGPVEATVVPNNKRNKKAVRAKRNQMVRCKLPDGNITEELAVAIAIFLGDEEDEDTRVASILEGSVCDDHVANHPRKCHRRWSILCLFGVVLLLVATLSTFIMSSVVFQKEAK